MHHAGRSRRALLTVALVAAMWLPGCARSEDVPTADVVVSLKDFKIQLSTPTVSSGRVVLGLENAGPTVHELVVARTDLPSDSLPIGADGLSVDEEAPTFRVLGEEEHVQLDEQEVLKLVMKPGHYVLYCNLEGHYLGGMHTDIEVDG